MSKWKSINTGKIDTVIVRYIDRIARDMLIREKWISDSKAKGIRVIALDGSHEQPSFVDDNASHVKRDAISHLLRFTPKPIICLKNLLKIFFVEVLTQAYSHLFMNKQPKRTQI